MLAILLLTCGAEPQFQVENRVPPKFEVVNKAGKTPCPNCTTCKDCTCFGGGYYCADGKCPIQFGTRANGYILRQHWDGRVWHQWWEPEGGSQTARPFSQTPAVRVSPSTNTTTAPPVYSNPLLVGQRGYRAGTSGGTIYMFAPGVGSSGSIENCGPLG